MNLIEELLKIVVHQRADNHADMDAGTFCEVNRIIPKEGVDAEYLYERAEELYEEMIKVLDSDASLPWKLEQLPKYGRIWDGALGWNEWKVILDSADVENCWEDLTDLVSEHVQEQHEDALLKAQDTLNGKIGECYTCLVREYPGNEVNLGDILLDLNLKTPANPKPGETAAYAQARLTARKELLKLPSGHAYLRLIAEQEQTARFR